MFFLYVAYCLSKMNPKIKFREEKFYSSEVMAWKKIFAKDHITLKLNGEVCLSPFMTCRLDEVNTAVKFYE